jgi:riboflavin kinase
MQERIRQMTRPDTKIPDAPTSPYPIVIGRTPVIPGFGRGSSDLGFPTANVDVSDNGTLLDLGAGVYFGFAKLYKSDKLCSEDNKTVNRVDGKSSVVLNYGRHLSDDDLQILPMVMSLGWNPYYGNKEKTCEIYIIHEFKESFYGADMSAVICGYLRPELDYAGVDALIKDIQLDVEIGQQNLEKPEYLKCKQLLQ